MEIMKVLVLSTAHLTEKDHTLLAEQSDPDCCPSFREHADLHPTRDEYSLWVYAGYASDDDPTVTAELCALAGFSSNVYEILRLAQQNDCGYVRFDRDGEKIDGLTLFVW